MLRKKILLIIICMVGITIFSSISNSYGHGLGFEILPPAPLGDRQVSLEVSSSPNLENAGRQVTFSLFDTETTVTIRDVTYHITAWKDDIFLFEDTFQSSNGVFIMNFVPSESNQIQLERKEMSNFFESLTGQQKKGILVKGTPFNSGGLFEFNVEILTAEKYSNKLKDPITFDVGLSSPDTTYYDIEDVNFGNQEFSLITYYAKINNFQYIQNSKSVSFSMPFEWTENNINQTSVVHQEIIISKTFGDLMVESLSVYVNEVKLPDYVITLDDFSEKSRIIHIVINQKDLFDLYQNYEMKDEMKFLIKPSRENLPLSSITGNGQYKIKMNWEPYNVKSGSELTLFFDITDVFLKDKPVSTSYEINIAQGENKIYTTEGISSDSREKHNIVKFFIPEEINGPISVQFDNLNGNSLARVNLPIVVNRINMVSDDLVSNGISIPDWVRENAGWWSTNQIQDNDFASGIEFMIKEGIIKVPLTNHAQNEEDEGIPNWVKKNAGWWSERLISDKEFVNGLQYLIKNEIISI